MFCVSMSPETLAWTLASAVLEDDDLPIRSCMYCMERFNRLVRLCMYSSDWWAKEKLWRLSDGNRFKSSVMMAGEEGPNEARDCSIVKDVERERLKDGLREAGLEFPTVPTVPLRGCDWRILLRPDNPRPWS